MVIVHSTFIHYPVYLSSSVFSQCLDLLDSPSLATIAFSLCGAYLSLATHVRHYRPVRALLARVATTDCFLEVLPELEEDLASLASDRFGHIIVISLLETAPPSIRERMIATFQGRVAALACHPVSHSVVVAAVGAASPSLLAAMIEEVCTVTTGQADMAVIPLTRDRQGHTVVLAMLQVRGCV